MTLKLDKYQLDLDLAIDEALVKFNTVCVQLSTGGGKTVIFSHYANKYVRNFKKDVIIFCDSEKILQQTRKTLFKWYGIDSDVIDANSSSIKSNTLFGTSKIFVAMVETFDRRAVRSAFLSQLSNVGLVIVDECHIGNFLKVHDHFLFCKRLGFTATPVSSDKKKPLKNSYQTIIIGPPTSSLIEVNRNNPRRGVVRDVTFSSTGNINRAEIEEEQVKSGWKGDDFNADITGAKLSGNRQIQNTINAYIEHAPGKKAICFNANVAHSKLVTAEMVKVGLNAMHMDASCSKEYKENCYKWFHETKNAILCNVGMTTKGFDETSVEVIILNRLTKSLPLYNQMCGRGGRPHEYEDGTFKEFFFVLDMCDNVLGGGHGQWSDYIDWKALFEYPKMPRQGVAPAKECPECHGICPASARRCKCLVPDMFSLSSEGFMECGYEFPVKEAAEDTSEKKLVLISKSIDVNKIVDFRGFQGKPEWVTFYETVRACAYFAKDVFKPGKIGTLDYEDIWTVTYPKIIEWQVIKGNRNEDGKKIRNTKFYTERGRVMLTQYLKEYGLEVDETVKSVLTF